MTTVEKIKQCTTPQSALLVLAEAIDEIVARLAAEPTPDVWAQPMSWADVPEDVKGYPDPEADAFAHAAEQQRLQAIDAVKLQLVGASGEEREALEARLRLLKDTPANILTLSKEALGTQVAIDSDGTQGSVELPPASPERQAERALWLETHAIEDFLKPLTIEEVYEGYLKGGPMWLYLGNRDAVMAMPAGWRQELVAECARDSQQDAIKMGRDVLKQASSISSETAVAYTDMVRR